jgi:hypothetical protein
MSLPSVAKFAANPNVPPLQEHHLPLPHWAYGLLALGFFAVLLGILWMFRNTAGSGRTSAGHAEAKSGH